MKCSRLPEERPSVWDTGTADDGTNVARVDTEGFALILSTRKRREQTCARRRSAGSTGSTRRLSVHLGPDTARRPRPDGSKGTRREGCRSKRPRTRLADRRTGALTPGDDHVVRPPVAATADAAAPTVPCVMRLRRLRVSDGLRSAIKNQTDRLSVRVIRRCGIALGRRVSVVFRKTHSPPSSPTGMGGGRVDVLASVSVHTCRDFRPPRDRRQSPIVRE